MRHGITIGFRHGSDVPQIITGPEVPFSEQQLAFKSQRATATHPDFARIALHPLDGGNGRHVKFKPVAGPKAVQPPAPKDSDKKPSKKQS